MQPIQLIDPSVSTAATHATPPLAIEPCPRPAIRRLIRLAVGGTLFCLALAGPASATGLPPFVGIGLSAQVTPNVVQSSSGSTAAYKTQNLGLPFSGYGDGLTVSIGSRSAQVQTTPAPMPAGLLEGRVLVQDAPLTALAGASLATGMSHVRADSAAGTAANSATAQTTLLDTVTWHVPGGQGADVEAHLHVDGSIGGIAGSAIYNQQVTFSIGGSAFGWAALANAFIGTEFVSTGLASWSFSSLLDQSATGFDFTGTFHVEDGERSAVQLGQLLTCTDGATCDFENTAAFSFRLPEGVSYGSDSGVLLSVPEPTPAAAMTLGLAALLAAGRLRGERRA